MILFVRLDCETGKWTNGPSRLPFGTLNKVEPELYSLVVYVDCVSENQGIPNGKAMILAFLRDFWVTTQKAWALP